MYQTFGARVTGNRVEFNLFLPDARRDPTQYTRGGLPKIRSIHVRGDFQGELGGIDWSLDPALEMTEVGHPNGLLYHLSPSGTLPDGYYQYKYYVEFENGTTRWVGDPCTKYGGSDKHENSAFVVGGNPVAVQPHASRRPPRDLIIYELMIDDFTKELRGTDAPIDAVSSRLDYLQDLGINAIEFMPWTAWAGNDFSWGYNPVYFFSVEYRYINDDTAPADKLFRLSNLINHMHERQMNVILDGVFNHVDAGSNPNRGFPYLWLYQDPEDSPFVGNFAGGGFFEDFDYHNKCTEELIRDICIYWLERFQIDGLRFDYTLGFFEEGNPNVGISKLVRDLRQFCAQTQRDNVALFLEHLTDNRYDAIDDTNQICADGCWFDRIMYEHFEYARNGNIDDRILRILNASHQFAANKGPVTYIQNHDHSTIVHEAGGRDRWYKTQPPAISLLTSPGAVMIHNGQEFGEDKFLPGSGAGRVVPRPLRWNADSPLSGDFVGGRLFGLYRHLIAIRVAHPALRSPNFFPYPSNHPDGYGAFLDKDVVIYHRWGSAGDGRTERITVIANYSDFDQWVDVPFSFDGQWEDLLNGNSVTVSGNRLVNQRINSNWGRIYWRKG
jgi:pullulanase